MAPTTFTPGDRAPMSWDDYESLGEVRGAEYIDGELVMSAAPNRPHQRISFALATVLNAALPATVEVIEGWGWKPDTDEFVPDVMVVDRNEEVVRYTGTPDLVVEIFSSDPARDMLRKLRKYEAAGVPRCWIVDPDGPEVHVYELDAETSALRHIATHAGATEVTLDSGPATITLTPADLLG